MKKSRYSDESLPAYDLAELARHGGMELPVPLQTGKFSDKPNFIDILIEARNWLGALGGLHRLALYHALATAASIAAELENATAWDAFCKANLVSKPLTAKDQKNALRWSIAAITCKNDKAVSDYVRAVKLLLQQGVRPFEIQDELVIRGGIKALISGAADKTKASERKIAKKTASSLSKTDRLSLLADLRFSKGVRTPLDIPSGKSFGMACTIEAVGPPMVIRVSRIKVAKA